MGFRSKSAAAPDAAFPFLTEDEGRSLRALALEEYRRCGLDVELRDDHLEGPSGAQYGLHSLASQCHAAGGKPRTWRSIIRSHASVLAETEASTAVKPTLEDLRTRAYARVVDRLSVPPEAWDWFRYARPIGESLMEVLALDNPRTVTILRDEDLADFDLDEVRSYGIANLRRDSVDERETVDLPDGGSLHVLGGSSMFIASRALLLDEELAAVGGSPHGAVLVMPDCHGLSFHPIRDTTVVSAMRILAGFAPDVYLAAASPVSPFLYWWHDGALTQIGRRGDDGNYGVEVDGEFQAVLNAVVGDGDD
jgi:hypothetical protein